MSQHIEKRGKYNLVYFSSVQQALNKEVLNHPQLMEYLRNKPAHEMEIRLAQIAEYCGLALDGIYDGKDIDNICALCLAELKSRSTQIILPLH